MTLPGRYLTDLQLTSCVQPTAPAAGLAQGLLSRIAQHILFGITLPKFFSFRKGV